MLFLERDCLHLVLWRLLLLVWSYICVLLVCGCLFDLGSRNIHHNNSIALQVYLCGHKIRDRDMIFCFSMISDIFHMCLPVMYYSFMIMER